MLHQIALNNYTVFLERCVSPALESRKAFSFQHHRISRNNNQAVVAYVFWHLLGRTEKEKKSPEDSRCSGQVSNRVPSVNMKEKCYCSNQSAR